MKFNISNTDKNCKGIYKITCLKNGKIYIGSTNAIKGFISRYWRHTELLKKGIHWNIHLQRSWDKYGMRAFVFELMEVLPQKSNLKYVHLIEQQYLDKLKTLKSNQIFNKKLIAAGGSTTGTSKFNKHKDLIIKLRNENVSYNEIVNILQKEYQFKSHWHSLRAFYFRYCNGKKSTTRGKCGISVFSKWHKQIINLRKQNKGYVEIVAILKTRGLKTGCSATLFNYCKENGIDIKIQQRTRKGQLKCNPYRNKIIQLRKHNHTYSEIADILEIEYGMKCNYTTIGKYLNKAA